MTEDEAKTKWCPFARVAFEDSGTRTVACSVNRGTTQQMDLGFCGAFGINCIGSACMAWQWEADVADESYGHCGLVR